MAISSVGSVNYAAAAEGFFFPSPSSSSPSSSTALTILGQREDPVIAMGRVVSQALGNAQINQMQGLAQIAATIAVKRIHAQVVAAQHKGHAITTAAKNALNITA